LIEFAPFTDLTTTKIIFVKTTKKKLF